MTLYELAHPRATGLILLRLPRTGQAGATRQTRASSQPHRRSVREMIQQIQHFDLVLFQLVNAWCGDWMLDRIAAYEEHNDLFRGGIFMVCYWWFWFAGCGERLEVHRHRIIAALIGVFIALVAARTLANTLPFPARPMYAAGIGYHPPSIPLDAKMEHWSSFPSDTATLFFALSFGIFRLSRYLGLALMAYSAVWISSPATLFGNPLSIRPHYRRTAWRICGVGVHRPPGCTRKYIRAARDGGIR